MDDTTRALEPIDVTGVVVEADTRYADDLARVGALANAYADTNAWQDYHDAQSANTKARHQHDLKVFCTYLAEAGVHREVRDLQEDAKAWEGMTYGLVAGFRAWMKQKGYSIGSINTRLYTVRSYCHAAYKVGVIGEQEYALISAVKGYKGKEAQNIDASRRRDGIPTRVVLPDGTPRKKARATMLLDLQAQHLKRATLDAARHRARDKQLELRDHLLIGLLVEHALRVSEVVGLDLDCFDLSKGQFTFYRSKVDKVETHRMHAYTRLAAQAYLASCGRTSGPLFVGYSSERISRQGVYVRVRALGESIGVARLSPHDLRHYWTRDVLQNGTSLDHVQRGGGWKSARMVLHYAARDGIANEGCIITE